jgi:glucose/arabinose dehydrogenase
MSPSRRLICASAIAGILVAAHGLAQTQQPSPPAPLPEGPILIKSAAASIRVTAVKGFVYPWALAFLPNGELLVTEQGRNSLRLVRGGKLDPTPIAGLPQGITSQRRDTAGVDVAVHPRFAENHLIYVVYWKPKDGNNEVKTATLVQARLDDGNTLRNVKEIFQSKSWTDGPAAARIIFGRDGKIYLAIGAPGFTEQVGGAATAQDPGEHAGKVLRLNDDGSVPADNPFVGKPGYAPEIYALGIRNALGLTIHPETGELWETENGPQGGDEVNIIKPGRNYGWPKVTYGRAYTFDTDGHRSGLPPPGVQPPTSAPGFEEPITYYKPSIAISGMVFYTGNRFPRWKGNLISGGLVGMQLSRITFDRQGRETSREPMLQELRQRIRDVKQGPDGLLYVTTDMPEGAVLRLEPAPEG